MELKGKVIAITGASAGIGEATAMRLGRSGMKCVLSARSESKLDAIASQVPAAVTCPGDMTDPAMPDRIIDTAFSAYGRLDVFFNNAGVMHIGTVDEVDIDAVCRMIRLNVEALVRASYTVLRVFKTQGSGFLVNTSSFAGLKTFKNIGAYNATKFAVEAFSDALRMELAGTGVRVACVEPGRTQTHLFDHWKPEQRFSPEEGMIPADAVACCIQFILEQPQDVVIPRLLVMPSRQPT